MPLISAKPAMKVCDEDEAAIVAEHVDAARPLGGLDADRDREGARLDHRVGDRAEDEEPVRLVRPRSGVRQPSEPRRASLSSPDADRPVALERVLVVGIEPALGDEAQRLDQPPAVGIGIWSVGKASGGGARTAPGLSCVDRRRGRSCCGDARAGRRPWISGRCPRGGGGGVGSWRLRSAAGCRSPAPAAGSDRRLTGEDGAAARARRAAATVICPGRRSARWCRGTGERAVDVAQPHAAAAADRDDDLVGADRRSARCRRCRAGTPALWRPRKLTMSSWSMPSPETPMPPTSVPPR